MKFPERTFKDLKSLHGSFLLLIYHVFFNNDVFNYDIGI